jgi:hypothetical protein
MKTEIVIPTSLSEIPLKSYQEFMKVVEKSNDEEFIGQKTIEIFCGLKMKDVVKVKWSDVKSLTLHLNEIFKAKPKFQATFKIHDTEFGFIPNLEDMSFGEYIDLESNISKVETFHKAMAVMYRPITKKVKDRYEIFEYTGTDEFSEAMKYAPLNVVMGATVFFSTLGSDLVQHTLTSLEKELKKNPKLMISAKERNLIKDGDGTIQSMRLLKETLQNLMMLPSWELESVLPTLLTKDKKEKLKIEN